MFTVYILYSEVKQKFYTGQTQDFEKRLQTHNSGKNLSTKKGAPWILVWKIVVRTRSEAVILELTIKKRGAVRFIQDQSQDRY
jgi:putative endonuclease